jgi:hypothetical protein
MRNYKNFLAAVSAVAILAVTPAFAASGDANFGQVMSSIQASKTSPTQIQGLTTVKSVNVVQVDTLAKGNNMKALDEAVSKNESDITSLRGALTANIAVSTALTNAKVDVSKVVATDIAADGVLTVYVRG